MGTTPDLGAGTAPATFPTQDDTSVYHDVVVETPIRGPVGAVTSAPRPGASVNHQLAGCRLVMWSVSGTGKRAHGRAVAGQYVGHLCVHAVVNADEHEGRDAGHDRLDDGDGPRWAKGSQVLGHALESLLRYDGNGVSLAAANRAANSRVGLRTRAPTPDHPA